MILFNTLMILTGVAAKILEWSFEITDYYYKAELLSISSWIYIGIAIINIIAKKICEGSGGVYDCSSCAQLSGSTVKYICWAGSVLGLLYGLFEDSIALCVVCLVISAIALFVEHIYAFGLSTDQTRCTYVGPKLYLGQSVPPNSILEETTYRNGNVDSSRCSMTYTTASSAPYTIVNYTSGSKTYTLKIPVYNQYYIGNLKITLKNKNNYNNYSEYDFTYSYNFGGSGAHNSGTVSSQSDIVMKKIVQTASNQVKYEFRCPNDPHNSPIVLSYPYFEKSHKLRCEVALFKGKNVEDVSCEEIERYIRQL